MCGCEERGGCGEGEAHCAAAAASAAPSARLKHACCCMLAGVGTHQHQRLPFALMPQAAFTPAATCSQLSADSTRQGAAAHGSASAA